MCLTIQRSFSKKTTSFSMQRPTSAYLGHRILTPTTYTLSVFLTTRLWPPADPEFTRAPDPLPSTSYFKRPRLLNYKDNSDSSAFRLQILNKVNACEILKRHPHPNITHYLGCVIKDNLIQGLGFARYPISLPGAAERNTF